MLLDARVRTAHADAWAAEGVLREPQGGGTAALRNIRAMASGLPHPQWNGADVTGRTPTSRARGRSSRRIACRGACACRWGSRGRRPEAVPDAADGPHGAGLRARARRARPRAARGGPGRHRAGAGGRLRGLRGRSALQRPWLEPHLGAPGITVALAELAGEPVGTAYTLRSDGAAGPAVFLAGVAVAEAARRRGIAAAMSSWLLTQAFAGGARLAHLHPDTDAAARVYARLGFADAGALDIYVDCRRKFSRAPALKPACPDSPASSSPLPPRCCSSPHAASAQGLKSDNVTVVGKLPDAVGAIGARFSPDGDTMYVTSATGLGIYDITTPESPQLLSRLPLPHFENEDVDVGRDTVVITNDPSFSNVGAIYLIDVTTRARPPSARCSTRPSTPPTGTSRTA